MTLTLGTYQVDQIDNPGIISSMFNFVLRSKSKNQEGKLIGWIPDTQGDNKGYKKRKAFYNHKNTFTGMFPLKHIFVFLESYNKVIFLMQMKLTLHS